MATVVHDKTDLSSSDLKEAKKRASRMNFKTQADVLSLGAEVQKNISSLDPEIDRVMMKDLGPVGEKMIAMQTKMRSLKPAEILNARPSSIDLFVERYGFLRERFGTIALFLKRYKTYAQVVNERSREIENALKGLVSDVTKKEQLISQYQKYEIEILIEAHAGKHVLSELTEQKTILENRNNSTIQDEHELARLKGIIQILSQRVANLSTAATLTKQAWVQMDTSRDAEWSLIEKTDSGKKFNREVWNQAVRATVSALRMCKASDLVGNMQAYTEAMMLDSAVLQRNASLQSADVGSRAIASLALMEKVNELAIQTIGEQNEIFDNSRAAMKEADLAMLRMRQELRAALKKGK